MNDIKLAGFNCAVALIIYLKDQSVFYQLGYETFRYL